MAQSIQVGLYGQPRHIDLMSVKVSHIQIHAKYVKQWTCETLTDLSVDRKPNLVANGSNEDLSFLLSLPLSVRRTGLNIQRVDLQAFTGLRA